MKKAKLLTPSDTTDANELFNSWKNYTTRVYESKQGGLLFDHNVMLQGQRILNIAYIGNSIDGKLYLLNPTGTYGITETKDGYILAENAKKIPLSTSYNTIVQKYVDAFIEKHFVDEYDVPIETESYWVDRVGGLLFINDFYINFYDIQTDIDEDTPKDKFFEWYNYCSRIDRTLIIKPRYEDWLNGCPRVSDEYIAHEQKERQLREEYEQMQEEQKDMAKFIFEAIHNLPIEYRQNPFPHFPEELHELVSDARFMCKVSDDFVIREKDRLKKTQIRLLEKHKVLKEAFDKWKQNT